MKLKREHTKILFYLLLLGFFLLLIYTILIYSNPVFAEPAQEPALQQVSADLVIRKNLPENIKTNILAKAYVIYDINNNKVVRSQNALELLPIASLTKIITVGTLLDTAKKNKIEIREDTKLKIKKALVQSSNEDADSLGYIYNFSFGKDLLEDSNKFIQSFGISDLRLTNLTGLDNNNSTASNIGSSESVAKMFAVMYEKYRDVFEYTKFEELETTDGMIKNTNHSANNTFGIMASKTGFTFEAGGNLGVVVSPEPGQAYVVLVMGSTKEGRFDDVKKLVKLLPIILKN